MLGNYKGFCTLLNDYNINSNLLRTEIVDIEKSAQLHKISESRGGKESTKIKCKVTYKWGSGREKPGNWFDKDLISDWHGAFKIKLN